ncbi:hypothetical protein, partial [Fulvivirga aurantia]|uniref:hypothetical protein n=1 Tax=Fulvivirga aurantia TaxID=2529383 RepID=UPI00162565D2
FQGWGALIRNRTKIKAYWQHTLWTIFAFTMFIQNWWGIWPRTRFITDNLFYFFYSLVPIFIFYIVSVILFPDFKQRSDRRIDMKSFFYKNTRWLFGLLAIYFLFTISSSFVYQDIGNVRVQNFIRIFGVVLAVTAAYYNKNKVLHIIFLVIGYAALIRFFMALPS